jgi:hypothetical protein
MSRRLIETLSRPGAVGALVGEVTAVSGSTVTVLVLGASVGNVRHLNSFTPVVGDSVLLLRVERSRFIAVGTIA